jgi:hypothetical protein
MNNSTNSFITNYLQKATNNDIIELVQSSCSLCVSVMIFVKVFDFQAYFSSVKKKRLEIKKNKEKREFEKMKVLFEAMKKDNLDNNSLSTDDEAEEKSQEPLKMTRKKKKQNLTPNENAVYMNMQHILILLIY